MTNSPSFKTVTSTMALACAFRRPDERRPRRHHRAPGLSPPPLTGPQAHYGEDMRNGLTLALEEANAKGIKLDGDKAKFVLVSKDDQADPRTAVQVAQQIADDKVHGMLGHFQLGHDHPRLPRVQRSRHPPDRHGHLARNTPCKAMTPPSA